MREMLELLQSEEAALRARVKACRVLMTADLRACEQVAPTTPPCLLRMPPLDPGPRSLNNALEQ